MTHNTNSRVLMKTKARMSVRMKVLWVDANCEVSDQTALLLPGFLQHGLMQNHTSTVIESLINLPATYSMAMNSVL